MAEIEPSDSELEAAMRVLITAGAESEDMTLIGYVPPQGSLCANTMASSEGSGGVKVNCGGEAGLSCGRCQLVRVSHYNPAICQPTPLPPLSANLLHSYYLTRRGFPLSIPSRKYLVETKVIHNPPQSH